MKQIEIPVGQQPIAMGTGEVHFRDFSLNAGEFLHVVVEQEGVDVVVSLRDPQGTEILRADSPTGQYGPEEILQIAELGGRYRVEIQPVNGVPEAGHYSIREISQRPARPQDREWVAADRLTLEGRRLAAEKAWQEAIQHFSRALEIWRRLNLHPREAETLRQLGLSLYQSGDLPAARDAWDRALSWYRALGDRQQSFLLHDLGRLELRLGDVEAAVSSLEEARSLFEKQGDERGLVSTLAPLGTARRTQGSFQRALECFEKAAERSQRLSLPELEADVQIDRGALLLELDRTEEALAAYQRALTLYQGLADSEGVASAFRGIADVGIRTDSLGPAEEAAQKAIQALGASGASHARASALNSLGNVRRKRGDWAGARQALEEALAVARAGHHRRDEAIILTDLAYAVARGGEPPRGLQLYEEALQIFREMGSQSGEAMVLARSAETLRDLGHLEEAWQRLNQALQAIEGLRATTNRQDYRLSYFSSRQDYYETAVDVLMDLEGRQPGTGFASRAFRIHERRQARELLEALTLADGPRVTADPDLLAQEQRLERELSELASQPGSATDDRLAQRIEDLQQVRGRILAARPVKREKVETTDLEAVRARLLDEGSLALVYSLGRERSYLFEISKQAFRVHPLPSRELVESKALDFLGALQQTNARSAARQAVLAKELGDLLLAPVADRLGSNERLVIVADGVLQGLPFAALVIPGEQNRFLIESHEIIYLPSWSMLERLRSSEAHRPAARGLLGVLADPVLSSDDERATGLGTAAAAMDDPYPRLPGSRLEAENLQALWQGKAAPFVAVGFEANREALLKKDWSGFEVLYFATHAVSHRRPGLSGLVLSMLDARGRPQPGFVTDLEISHLSLPVDLVVLSACETASGERVRGEGTLGLSWSFLQAGATRVVATLWRVGDRQTAELMTRFLELYRRDGLSPSTALHRAQQEAFGRPGALPRDWAGFVFIGDWESGAQRRRR